jgi:energy-coupling factor transport system substrate-specific component
MKLWDSIKKDFNTMTWVLIPVAIAINIVIGEIVGALTGALSNTIWGLLIDPNSLPWWPVALFIGFVAGWCAVGGLFKTWWKVIIAGFLVALTAAIASTPIAVYLYGGITASGSSFITAYLLQTGQGVFQAVFSTNFLVEPVDKISTCLLAFAIIQGLSGRFLARFPRPENVELEKKTTRTQLWIAVGVVVVLVLIAAFVLTRILTQ